MIECDDGKRAGVDLSGVGGDVENDNPSIGAARGTRIPIKPHQC